jgi:serine/threonine-protein kinase
MARIADLLPSTLGGRIFLLSGTLVAVAMTLAVGFTAWRANTLARESVARSLDKALATQVEFGRSRATQLRLTSRVVAGDPSFVAYVAESDDASVRDLLFERQRELECDWAAVLDRTGRLIAHTGRVAPPDPDLAGTAAVASALRGAESVGLLSANDQFYFCTAIPLVAGGTSLEGVLVLGLAMDEAYVLQMKRQSGAEVAMIVRRPDERVIATTLATGPDLLAAIRAHGTLEALLPASGEGSDVVLEIGGRRWAAAALPVFGNDGPLGLLGVTLASLDEAVEPYRLIEQALLLTGAAALLAAFALSFALSRRVTRPLEQLASAVEAARRGRYDEPLPSGSRGEVGRLARAFDSLFGELREQRDIGSYLAALSRTLPDTREAPPQQRAMVAAGTVLGQRFEILSFLGAGGMGIVYKARDRQLKDVVALKTLNPTATSEDGLERLKNELRIARRITHRNVLRTHDFGDADGVPFISMEYVRGVTLRELLEQTGELPFSIALRIARQLLGGLEAAHAMGIVHGDIKPENLILDATGQLRIMDFGIAHAARDAREQGGWEGTLGYLAPEQLAGQPGDTRSDLYACGVVMFEMLTGRRPFPASASGELFYRVMNEEPPSLRDHAPQAPERLADLVARCLARDPAARPAGAAALLAELEEIRP